jgi:carboxylesterase
MVAAVQKILKTFKSILFADPRSLYKEEIELVNRPFKFPGTNGKAVLLLHGWTSMPYELRRLGEYLNEKGYTVFCPLLRGHGTIPKDLEKIKWTDWLVDSRENYRELKSRHERVYIIGTSIGASLASLLAAEIPDVGGIVLMAMPYKLKIEKLVVMFAKILRIFQKYTTKHYPPTFGARDSITRLISYQSYPIESGLEALEAIEKTRENLYKVKQPCFIIQSAHDHIAKKNSLEKIYAGINSKVKKKKYILRAYHTFISDIKNESVFEEILNFLNEN